MAVEMKIDGNLVKLMREERAWSQEHLASVAGLSTRTVQRLEAEGNASAESRMAIAAVFGIEPMQLMQGQVPAMAMVQPAADAPGASFRMDPYKWIVLAMVWIIFMLVGGYKIGKDMALRDNRIQERCADNPADCKADK